MFHDEWQRRLIAALSKAMVARVKTKINKNCRLLLRDIVGSVGTSYETVCTILYEHLNLSKVSPHMVPKLIKKKLAFDSVRNDWKLMNSVARHMDLSVIYGFFECLQILGEKYGFSKFFENLT